MAEKELTLLVAADAEPALGPMLAHHHRLADEIVVIDTGAGAATAVADTVGARAVSCAWDDDFAAPRNAGLAAATGDWVLVLDVDELVAPGDFERMRQAMAEPPAVRAVTTVHYEQDPQHPQWQPVSGRYPHQEQGQTGCFLTHCHALFPRREGIEFRGRVQPTVRPAATALGLATRTLDVPVHHYGFVLGAAHDEVRRSRIDRAARRELADHPGDPSALLELATVLYERGDLAAAGPLLEQLIAGTAGGGIVNRGRLLLGRIRRLDGDLIGAGDVLGAAVDDDPDQLFCWLEWSRVAAARSLGDECERIFAAARRHLGDDPLLDREEMRYLLKNGRVRAAAELLARLRRTRPGWTDLQGLASRLAGRN